MARHANFEAFKGVSATASVPGASWLIAQLRANVYLHRLCAGDRLPPYRKLAEQLGVSPPTALQLYKKLEDAGVIESRHRSGTFLRHGGIGGGEAHANDAVVYRFVQKTVQKLRALGVSPAAFAHAILRYSDATPGPDVRFGWMTSQEVLEAASAQRHAHPGSRLPVVWISPDPAREADARAQLAHDRTIRCLVANCVFADRAVRLAEEFGLGMIVIQLGRPLSAIYEPPPHGRRFIVTRDADFASGIRHLLQVLHGPEGAGRFCVAALGEAERMAVVERDASEVYTSYPCLAAARARFGGRKTILLLPLQLSSQTLDEMMCFYTFATASREGRG